MRHRLITLGLYGFALSVAGVYFFATHREAVNAAIARLANCASCQRRKAAMARMMRQAQEAVGVVHDA